MEKEIAMVEQQIREVREHIQTCPTEPSQQTNLAIMNMLDKTLAAQGYMLQFIKRLSLRGQAQ